MIYIVSGVTRSGKSTLTRMLHKATGLPYFHLDHLMFGMMKAQPGCGFTGETDDMVKANLVGPLVVGILESMYEDGTHDYIVDGVCLLPQHVSQLNATYPDAFKACWLGYTKASLEQKYIDIRNNTAPDDWLNPYPDEYVKDIIAYGITKSTLLQQQCEDENITFFDTSANFHSTLDDALRYLMNEVKTNNQ